MTEPETTTEKPKRKFVKKNITVKPEQVVIGASFPGKVVRYRVTSPHAAMSPPVPHRKRPASAPSRTFPTATTPAFFATSIGRAEHGLGKPGGFDRVSVVRERAIFFLSNFSPPGGQPSSAYRAAPRRRPQTADPVRPDTPLVRVRSFIAPTV